jgi:integrase
MQRILDAIEFEPLKQIVIFAVNTGARISEILNVQWIDIDFHRKTVRIAQRGDFQTKTKRERTIPLNETLYDMLAGMERKGEYVFCRINGDERDKNYISRKFKDVLRKIGLAEGYKFHSLRHTFASLLVQKGVSIYKVSKLLGHTNVKTTEIYAYLAPEQFHEEVNLLDYQNPRDKIIKDQKEVVGEEIAEK